MVSTYLEYVHTVPGTQITGPLQVSPPPMIIAVKLFSSTFFGGMSYIVHKVSAEQMQPPIATESISLS